MVMTISGRAAHERSLRWDLWWRWARNTRIWWILFGATSLGWLLGLSVVPMVTGLTKRTRGDDLVDLLYTIAFGGMYQLTIGGVLATILQPDSRSQVT
jgi:hypothetical protein